MANAMYTVAKTGLLNGSIDLDNDDIRAVLVSSSYTFSAAHATMENANVPTAARIGSITALASESVSSGAFDAADLTFSSVASGTAAAIILFKYVTDGVSSDDIPICYIDTTSDASLPVVANGGDIVISWNGSGIITT
jgi:hypothetical protein